MWQCCNAAHGKSIRKAPLNRRETQSPRHPEHREEGKPAGRFNLPHPSWTTGETRQLRSPWFATPLAALRALLLLESPPAFRSRNLFVSGNALSRA